MAQKDVDELYDQIKATGKPGGVFISGSVTQTRTLRGTARITPVSTSAVELVGGPQGDDLPMTGKDARKLRSPKDFLDAARRYLDPEETGQLFADAVISAFKQNDTQMLKLLLPYLYGAAPKDESMGNSSDAMETLLHILTESRPQVSRPRQTKVVDGMLMDVSDPASPTMIFDPNLPEEEIDYVEEE